MLHNRFRAKFALFTFSLTLGIAQLRPAQAHIPQSVQVRCLANYSGCAISVDGVPHSRFFFLNPLSVFNHDETGPGWSETSGAYRDYPQHMDVPTFYVHSEYPEWRPDAQFSVVRETELEAREGEGSIYFRFAHMDEEMNFMPFASCSSTYRFNGKEQHDSHIVSVLGDSATQEPIFVDVEADPYEEPIVFKSTGNDGPMRRTLFTLADVHVAPYSSEALELQFAYPEGHGFSVEVLSALAVISAAR